MDNSFILKHKDENVALITLDQIGSALLSYKSIAPELSPYLGNSDLKKMKTWWMSRAVPGSRETMLEIVRNAECVTNQEYLAKNLGLSMTDSYWICPVDNDLKWNDVRLRSQKEVYSGVLPYHNASSYDPNAALGGQMDKYWDLQNEAPVLIKTATAYFGQQAINEEFASYFHKLQKGKVPYVHYGIIQREVDNALQCMCEAFTTDDIEFVPAYEVIESAKQPNDMSIFEFYIDICVKHGLNYEMICEYMDYQTLSDFVISNVDEHLQNFGLLRDANTMELICPAPIFDSGNSMYYSEAPGAAYSRAEILDRKITGMFNKEEKMISHVNNRKIIELDRLPSPSEVKDFYANRGIPEQKAEYIMNNYDTKVHLLSDFQQGLTISYYSEKKAEQADKSLTREDISEAVALVRKNKGR